SRSADKRVLHTIEQARVERMKPGGDQQAQTLLAQAATEASAAAATKAYAKAMLAQAQLDSAVARISDPSKDSETGLANGIDGQHRQISRLLWEIGQLGQQMRNTTILAKSYAQFGPTQARAVVQAQLADVNGQG